MSLAPVTLTVMYHSIELWRWRLTDPESGRRSVTRYRMTEAEARQVDPALVFSRSGLRDR
jgi:hypothetical protein